MRYFIPSFFSQLVYTLGAMSLWLGFTAQLGYAQENLSADAKHQFVHVEVQNVQLELQGVSDALQSLEQRLIAMTVAMEKLAASGGTLTEQDQLLLSQLRKNLTDTSTALKYQVEQLPNDAEKLHAYLNTLSSSLQQLQLSLANFLLSYPEVFQSMQDNVNASINHGFTWLIVVMLVIVLLLLSLVVIGIKLFYRQIMQPLMHCIDTLAKFPAQQQQTAELMQDITERLAQLQSEIPADATGNDSEGKQPAN